MLAEDHRVAVVHGHEAPRELDVVLERLLRGEERRRHDDEVEAAEGRFRRVEGRSEGLGVLEVTHGVAGGFALGASCREVRRALLELFLANAEEKDAISALCEALRDGPPHARGSAKNDCFHCSSPPCVLHQTFAVRGA